MTREYAERQLRYFERKVAELRQTSDVSDAKEKEGKRETFPPAPPIESKGKEEKAPPPPPARARARVFPPTVEQVEKFAALHGIAPAFAKAWFGKMAHDFLWRHPKSGQRILHWQAYFLQWWKRRDDFDPLPAHRSEDAIREREEAAAAALKGLGL